MEKIYKWRANTMLEYIRHRLNVCDGDQDYENIIEVIDNYLEFLGHISDE